MSSSRDATDDVSTVDGRRYLEKIIHTVTQKEASNCSTGFVKLSRNWQSCPMMSQPPSYRGYRFPPEIISHAVWFHYRAPQQAVGKMTVFELDRLAGEILETARELRQLMPTGGEPRAELQETTSIELEQD